MATGGLEAMRTALRAMVGNAEAAAEVLRAVSESCAAGMCGIHLARMGHAHPRVVDACVLCFYRCPPRGHPRQARWSKRSMLIGLCCFASCSSDISRRNARQ